MEIMECGSRPSVRGPTEYFTGSVRQDPVLEAPQPARVRVVTVTFEPGARTAWHTHPLGQTPHRDGWPRIGAKLGRDATRDSRGRRRLVSAGRKTLARCRAGHGDDPYRDPGSARRQSG